MTWIKADPSFEGLLLARHEYEGRVYVGSSPEQHERVEANPTKYLRSVRIDAPSLSTRGWFGGEELFLNSGLVAIIGNKGSGKSALTDAIALVADTKVEDHMSFLREERFRHQRLGLADKHQCEITWRSGDSEMRSLGEHADRHKPERVRYLPQSYFERLCSEIGQEAQDEFEKQLKQVVFTWLPSDRRMGTESLDDLIRVTTGQWRERHRLRTSKLQELNEQIATLERELQPDRLKDVRSQLTERQRELAAHDGRKPPDLPADPSVPSDAADEQLDEIVLLESRIAEIDTALEAVAVALTGLRKRRQDLDDLDSRITNVQAYFESQLQAEAVGAVLREEALTLDSIVELTIDRQPLIDAVENLEGQIDGATSQTGDLRIERDALGARRQALLNELDEERRAQREAEEAVQRWQSQRAGIVGAPGLEGTVTHLEAALEAVPFATAILAEELNARAALTREMFSDLRRLRNSYSDLFGPIQKYLEEEELLGEGLTMRVDALIRQDGFAQQFLEMIDRTKKGAFFQSSEDGLRPRLAAVDFGDQDSVEDFLTTLMDELVPYDEDGRPTVDLDTQLKGRVDREAIYDFVFGLSYLQPHYALTFNEKQIAQLSPGERGAALLIFYLLVDKSELPIMLDQPEENLDNATVSRLLVPAIRKARQRRQVIVVTHNPNLAVYCDADQVIYSDIARTPSTKISYRAGSLENVQTRRWVIDVLEGTGRAFRQRHIKYGIGPHGELVLKGD